MNPLNAIYALSFLTAAAAFLFALYLYLWVKRQKVENSRIQEVSALIAEGARAFMDKEYRTLVYFALPAAALVFLLLPSPIWTGSIVPNIQMAVAYAAGTVLSAVAGRIGIMVAALSNGRAAERAQNSLSASFLVGFRGGAVMGLLVVGTSLFGITAVLLAFRDTSILLGFSFGASSLALFAKAGGGRPHRQGGAGDCRG